MATELAKAYVQIVPSADGIKDKLEQTLGKESESAGKNSGKNIASGIKSAILKLGIGALIVKGVSEATSAISSLVSESVSAFADTEQLSDGVKKLFGDIDYQTVIDNANAAFSTVGISANQYMETVTGFSAALISSLEGDTTKAADLADVAMRDMSDNANTFGTDIESIQNAYQGFAKGNFTMLDNLKLGYGGTEEEMERLLETASEISGIDYDIDNFSDIVSAIHVIQADMDIMGTTENEAMETISGSMSRLKASWENFLGSMAQGDEQVTATTQSLVESIVLVMGQIEKVLPTILPNVVNGLVNVANALIPQIPGIIDVLLPPLITAVQSLLTGLLTVLPELLQVLVDVLPMAIDTILTMLPLLLQTAIDLITVLANGLIEALPTLVPAVVDIVLTLVDTLMNNLDMLLDVTIQIIIALADGLIAATPIIIEKLPVIAQKLQAAMIKTIPQLVSAIGEIILKLAGAIVAAIPQLVSVTTTMWLKFKEALLNAFSKMPEIGKEIMEGLKKGLTSGITNVVDTAKNAASTIISNVKGIFGIHSPSKEFAWIGEMCDAGLAEGLEGMSETVADAKNGIKAEMADGMDFNTSITASGALSSAAALSSSEISDSNFANTVASAVYNALNNLTIKTEMNPNTAKFFESMRAEAISYQRRTGNEAWA